jgi:eukaryotic-like serine/threonine-protein kinase
MNYQYPDAEQIGRIIDGRYRILELIGQGGMGSVYKAEHTGIRRIVALKLLHPVLAQVPDVSRRFEREAFAIGRIEHPNCVNVSDFGRLDDGSLYLVMEYLEGHSLGDELAEHGRVEPLRALHILRHVLRGLGHAHENDIVHRDVKPENVLIIQQDGDPDFAKILDFGIAKLIGAAAEDDGTKLTQAGMAFGTPIYMSPEQAVGNPIDGRADLYAASIMGYEMITGRAPFESDDKLEVMSMHTSRPVPPMREVAPHVDVDPRIEEIILRGLQKRPRDRYASATEYIATISTIVADPSMLVMTATGVVPVIRAQTVGPVVYGPPMATPVPGELQHGAGHAGPAQDSMDMAYATATQASLAPPDMVPEKRSRRRSILAVAAAASVLLAVLMIVRGSGSGGTPAEQAARKLSHGDPQGAIALLEGKADAIAEDAAAQLQLGHAYALARADKKALDAYRKALALNAALADDSRLRANLNVLRDGKNLTIAVEAAEILASELNDDEGKNKLIEFASSMRNESARHRAIELVKRHGLSDRVDWVESYMLDLRQGDTCRVRRKYVAKLRELGDKRAVKALRTAAYRKGTSGSSKGKLINRCLRQEALDAAEYLDKLSGEAGTPETPGDRRGEK